MNNYQNYVTHLQSLLKQALETGIDAGLLAKANEALDGQPAARLRESIPLPQRRTAGAFFTSAKLSQIALGLLAKTINEHSIVIDPACGAGDLLIQYARHLPKRNDLEDTLEAWSKQIIGLDLYPEFVESTKLRLALICIIDGLRPTHPSLSVSEMFPMIRVQNGLDAKDSIGSATHILLNPPFTMVEAPKDCNWASGKVNAAALFLESCVQSAAQGTRIVAILPDVLRSGSRYVKWREFIRSHTKEHRVELYGQFDQWTDVDVYILDLEVINEIVSHITQQEDIETLGDRFQISIGPVVDFRDPHVGPAYPFITPRDLPAWETVKEIARTRKFSGRVIQPPFVAVRRTSRQGDKYRAIGTIIQHGQPVAVENHLIVLKPKDDSVDSCNELLEVLQKPETTKWFDQRIRCRHLTTIAMAELPWWGD